MGEMADFTLDSEDFDDQGLYGPGGLKSCKFCFEGRLHWENLGSLNYPIWRLCNDQREVHDCGHLPKGENA